MVGASMLVNIALGTCHRPKREQLWASKVHDLITRFFFDIEAPITDYGGAVHAYVGDEVIVTWLIDTAGARNARCLCAAIDHTIAEK